MPFRYYHSMYVDNEFIVYYVDGEIALCLVHDVATREVTAITHTYFEYIKLTTAELTAEAYRDYHHFVYGRGVLDF